MITVPYSKRKNEFYKVLGRIINPDTGRKMKAYFTSKADKKEATKQCAREKTRIKRQKRVLKKLFRKR